MFPFFHEQHFQNAAFCKESFFTCLTYKNVQRFRNGPVHEFYGLKASQMTKIMLVLTNNHMSKKFKNLREQNWTEFGQR